MAFNYMVVVDKWLLLSGGQVELQIYRKKCHFHFFLFSDKGKRNIQK